MANLGDMKMKNIVIIFSLILSSGICFAAQQKGCSTGFACPLDKLRAQEQLLQQQRLVDEIKQNNEKTMFKMNNFDGYKKEYNDFFLYTKPKQN